MQRINATYWNFLQMLKICRADPKIPCIFESFKKGLDSRRIHLLLGPRRVGKSIIIKQTIDSLLLSGVDPSSILYYSMDDPALSPYSDNLIKDLIDYHEENIGFIIENIIGLKCTLLEKKQIFFIPVWLFLLAK